MFRPRIRTSDLPATVQTSWLLGVGGGEWRDDVIKNDSENILIRWDGGRIYELIFKRVGLSPRALQDCQRVTFRISAICIISVREGEGGWRGGAKERCVIRRGRGHNYSTQRLVDWLAKPRVVEYPVLGSRQTLLPTLNIVSKRNGNRTSD